MVNKVFVGVLLIICVVMIMGCTDEQLYLSNVYNQSGGDFVQGNCTGGIKTINSSGGVSCRDISSWYWHIESNESSWGFNGSGDMLMLLNDSNSGNATFYVIIGDDVQ